MKYEFTPPLTSLSISDTKRGHYKGERESKALKQAFSMAELLLALLVVSIIVSATIPTFTKKGATNEQVFKWSQNNGSGYSIAEPIIIGSNRIPGTAGGSVDDKFAITKEIAPDGTYANDSFITFYDYPIAGTYNQMSNRGRLFTDEYNLGIGFHVLNNLKTPDDDAGTSENPKYKNKYNTVFGHNAQTDTVSGNTAIGYGALGVKSNLDSTVSDRLDKITNNTYDLHGTFGHRGSNTAVGAFALANAMKSTGTASDPQSYASANTAVGALALYSFKGLNTKPQTVDTAGNPVDEDSTTQDYGNVAIGGSSLSSLVQGSKNIAIGVEAAKNLTAGHDNIAIGFQSLKQYDGGGVAGGSGGNNIGIGSSALSNLKYGNYNVAIGNDALVKAKGTNTSTTISANTVVGMHSMKGLESAASGGNVAIGYGLGNNLASASHSILIGYNSASNSASISNTNSSIIIGSDYNPTSNPDNKLLIGMNSTEALIDGTFIDLTDASGNVTTPKNITINGDLIVKGNIKVEGDTGETLFQVIKGQQSGNTYSDISKSPTNLCEGNCDNYAEVYIKGNAGIIGTLSVDAYDYYSPHKRYNFPMMFDGLSTTGQLAAWKHVAFGTVNNTAKTPTDNRGLMLYAGNIAFADENANATVDKVDVSEHTHSASSTSTSTSSSNNAGSHWGHYSSGSSGGSHSHTITTSTSTTTTIGTPTSSDIRLKDNISDNHAGLKEINQLEVKNFTFKKDENKTPHVGVIAQSLQKVFPNAVKADEDGYLMIRWEDMFYAMINAIKELYTNFQDLTAKITGLDKRIEELEKQNKELEARLEKLEKKQAKKEKKEKKLT